MKDIKEMNNKRQFNRVIKKQNEKYKYVYK